MSSLSYSLINVSFIITDLEQYKVQINEHPPAKLYTKKKTKKVVETDSGLMIYFYIFFYLTYFSYFIYDYEIFTQKLSSLFVCVVVFVLVLVL